MRTASAELIAFLLTKQPYWSADLFTITLANGDIYRWTGADQPITYGVNTWLANGPTFQRSRWSVKKTLEVPDMVIKVVSSNDDFEGQNFKTAMAQGLLDGAKIDLDRAFMPTYGDTSLGLVRVFAGRVSVVEIGSIESQITVKGANVLLQSFMPRNQYQLGCMWQLYSDACGAVRASSTFTGVVGAASTVSIIKWGTPRSGDGSRFTLGVIEFTSGTAAGQLRTIQLGDDDQMQMAYPLYEGVSPGDTFEAVYGCNKTRDTCALFGRTQTFRGFPYIPAVETAL